MLTPERVREIRERAENYQGSADKVILYAQIEDLRRTVLALCGAVEEQRAALELASAALSDAVAEWTGGTEQHTASRSWVHIECWDRGEGREWQAALDAVNAALAPGAEREGRE